MRLQNAGEEAVTEVEITASAAGPPAVKMEAPVAGLPAGLLAQAHAIENGVVCRLPRLEVRCRPSAPFYPLAGLQSACGQGH